jgi:2-keto-4-pentenoate hydratase
MTGSREATLLQAVDTLLDARRTNTPIADLPAELQPADMDEVYFIQDRLAEAFAVETPRPGGFKIGAPNPEATPVFAPMPLAWIAPSGSILTTGRYRGLEAEIAFLVGSDLPPRTPDQPPYTREETLAAMASCHPVIEVLESAFIDPTQASKLAALADLQMHGGFIYGAPFLGPDGEKAAWHTLDFNTETVTLAVDGVLRVERTGSNTSGDLLKLLPWLANHGATRTGGLHAGQWITTGSWTGNTLATSSSVVNVTFAHAGRVDLRFA